MKELTRLLGMVVWNFHPEGSSEFEYLNSNSIRLDNTPQLQKKHQQIAK